MSHDVGLVTDDENVDLSDLDAWNYTSNCARMWREAGADIDSFHGKPAGDCSPVLRSAIEHMEANPEQYLPLNPPNGWGSYDTLLPALRQLLAMFDAAPTATVLVWS